jgi:hypothetical protein
MIPFCVYWIKSAQNSREEGDSMRKRRRRICWPEWLGVFAVAFGVGLFLSLFCSVKTVLFLAAVALVCFGLCNRRH